MFLTVLNLYKKVNNWFKISLCRIRLLVR